MKRNDNSDTANEVNMMKKKRTAIILTVLLASILLPGCKKNVGTPEDNPVQESTDENPSEEARTFVYSCAEKSDPFYDVLGDTIRSALEEKGDRLIIKDAEADPVRQAEQLQEVAAEKEAAGVFLTLTEEETVTPALEELKEAGIPVVSLCVPLQESGLAEAYVGADEANAGRVCGQDLTEKRSSGGRLVIVERSGDLVVNERITGFEEAILNQGFEVVRRVNADGTEGTIQSEIAGILKDGVSLDAIMCGDDSMAADVLAALAETGNTSALVYSVGGSPEVKKALADRNSQMAGTGALSPVDIGKTAVKTATAILDSEAYEKETIIDTFLIDRNNLEIYGTDGWQ